MRRTVKFSLVDLTSPVHPLAYANLGGDLYTLLTFRSNGEGLSSSCSATGCSLKEGKQNRELAELRQLTRSQIALLTEGGSFPIGGARPGVPVRGDPFLDGERVSG